MALEGKHLRIEPNDFSDFVYCGSKWLLDKLEIKKNYYETEKTLNIKIGVANEYKCVSFILDKLNVSRKDVLYVGINDKNSTSVVTEIASLGVKMQCKPDLIVRYKNRTRLFEFKSVGEAETLKKMEFDSYHAQVWCYKHLNNFEIDDYYLFRYFKNPYTPIPKTYEYRYINKPYEKKRLVNEIESSKFLNHFEEYVNAVEILKQLDRNKIQNLIEKLKTDFSPKNDFLKCTKCYYKIYNRCPVYDGFGTHVL